MSQPLKKVENLGQAVSVLVQGIEIGRSKGIYDWDALDLLNQAIKFINIVSKSAEAETTTEGVVPLQPLEHKQ